MRTVLSLLPVAVLVVCGCESEPGPVPVYPVSGQVLYAGKPAAGVHVYFNAAGGTPTPVNPHAVTGPDGKFTLSTYADGDGAPEGSYQVLMTWPPEVPEGAEPPDTDRLQGWYGMAHSKLTAQVKAGENTLPPFQLPAVSRPAGEIEGIPGRN
ncbi:MAG TPA: hypothetical protein VM533_08825 [Fimbriiglobus sp.]|nr:hypothetical protein [Fimbriiglobus sp.]